jgi:hypothetical protein
VTFEDVVARRTEAIERLRARGLSDVTDPEQTARALVLMTVQYLRESYGRDEGPPVGVAGHTLAEIWSKSIFSPRA